MLPTWYGTPYKRDPKGDPNLEHYPSGVLRLLGALEGSLGFRVSGLGFLGFLGGSSGSRGYHLGFRVLALFGALGVLRVLRGS